MEGHAKIPASAGGNVRHGPVSGSTWAEGPAEHALRREVDIGDLIDARPLGFRQIATLALCLLVVLLDGFDNQAIALVVPAMSRDLHIPLSQFGSVFGMAAIGMILSAMVVGPLADRAGRKRMLVLSTLCFGAGSFLTAHAQTLPELLALRFVTGIGLGGVLPNVIAIAAEFSPRRLSRTCIAMMVSGLPAGAMAGALIASALLPAHGWKATYYVGGIAPVVVAIAVALWMPESVRYLIARDAAHDRISRIVRIIAPDVATHDVRFVSRDGAERRSGSGTRRTHVREIFAEGRAWATIFLWIPYFMNLMVLYFSISWLPSLIIASGRSMTVSTAAITAFSIGGILGSLGQGPLMNRFGAARVLTAECGAAFLYATLLGTTQLGAIGIVAATAVAGYMLIGVQAGLNALAAEIYPTAIRATGAGWALGAGRLGSIVGPLLGGVMIGLHWDAQQIFLATAVPSLLAVAAIYVGHRRK